MRSIDSKAYDIVDSLGDRINKLVYDPATGIYNTPYTEVPLTSFTNNQELTMFQTEDIAFCNTSEFSKTGREYIKTGKYTQAHPKYDSREYNAFWDEEERRCIEGMTLPGKLIKGTNGEYKLQDIHITGEHYGYLNYAEIKRSKDFEVKKGILYSPNGEAINKSNSSAAVKEFSFPAFWDGDYYFFKAVELCRQVGKHLVVGKARRKGYSYKNGWMVANKANLYRRSTSVVGAYDSASLFDDGTMTKVDNYLNFINKHTDWNKRRLLRALDHICIGFRYKGDDAIYGFNSNIYTSILKGNPGGMRGKDADLLLLEEAGKCPNMSEILDATMKTLSDGSNTTGLFIAFGTGGGDDNQWQGFEDLFYEPYARKFIMFENIWDEDMLGTGCGYFHGSFMNKPGVFNGQPLIDEHGNSNIKQSVAFDTHEKSMVAHDPSKLNAYEMEEPEKPSQAFSRASNNIFPAKELDQQLRKLIHDPELKGIGREGIFIERGGKIKFLQKGLCTPDEESLIPPLVNNYPLNPKDDIRGCWNIWSQPYRDKSGNIPENLYSLWNDPYGISKDKEHYNSKDSLAVTWIYENPNNFTPTKGDRLVGCFIGRREDTEEYDDQMFLGCMYFNGTILYENDRGDVFSNAKKRGLLDLLKTEPEFHYQKDLAKGGGGRKRGISIAGNSGRKSNGVLYLKKWLIEKRGVDNNGNNILNLHYIYDIGFIKELLKYDGKRNADRVSAAIVGMFDIRETLHKGTLPENANMYNEDDDYFNNPFNHN